MRELEEVDCTDDESTDVDGVGDSVEPSDTGTSKSGRAAGMGWAAWVVVFSAGAKASSSIALRLSGHMPVFRKALQMVLSVNAFSRAFA